MSASESSEERHIWSLLVRDFVWRPDRTSAFDMLPTARSSTGRPKFQLFEVLVTALMSRLRPDYRWSVSANLPDEGTDFLGRSQFLISEPLGISAAITVGGQCKKRSTVNDVVDALAGSLMRMAKAENPTFFVVAFSANLSGARIERAQAILRNSLGRDCHILQRRQLEGLMRSEIDFLRPIIESALGARDAEQVVRYLVATSVALDAGYAMTPVAPSSVRSGEPFGIAIELRGPLHCCRLMLRWRLSSTIGEGGASACASIVGPIGIDTPRGIEVDLLVARNDNPFVIRLELQFLTYAVGQAQTGFLEVVADGGTVVLSMALPEVRAIENARPRFFEAPVREILLSLRDSWDIITTGTHEAVFLVGQGGSGKSRVAEEFAIEVRRRGATAVVAKQANNFEYPNRIFADLLIALADISGGDASPSKVIDRIATYDAGLANAASVVIADLLGSGGKSSQRFDDQRLISAAVLLLCMKGRQSPVIVHLQDLHWCTADTLDVIDRLIWQMGHVRPLAGAEDAIHGVLFLLEGREGEEFDYGSDRPWSTRSFEMFMRRSGRRILRCRPYTAEETCEFTRRLFETAHSAHRAIPLPLLGLQGKLVQQIADVAGQNPFHVLEQIRFLKYRAAIRQNPVTGFYFLARFDSYEHDFAPSIVDAIIARWRYLETVEPDLALLVWSVTLLSERVPMALFVRLWSSLAPSRDWRAIEATEFIAASLEGTTAALKHENYFQAIRRIQATSSERDRVVGIYRRWLDDIEQPNAQQLFDRARLVLASAMPDIELAATLLRKARDLAAKTSDDRLLRRILSTLVDEVLWMRSDSFAKTARQFLSVCSIDLELAQILAALGERNRARERLHALESKINCRLGSLRSKADTVRNSLLLLKFGGRCALMDILTNGREAERATELGAETLLEVEVHAASATRDAQWDWQAMERDIRHAYAVALALDGRIDEALRAGEQALVLARNDAVPGREKSLDTLSTYANILLARLPTESEALLREALTRQATPMKSDIATRLHVNLAMALIVRSQRDPQADRKSALAEARAILAPVFSRSIALGYTATGAAAALLIGIIDAMTGRGSDGEWFAQAMAAATHAQQSETLWRAHINLAMSLDQQGRMTVAIAEHAGAAYDILWASLSAYAQPDRSARFKLVRIPLAHTVRFLLCTDHAKGLEALRRLPDLAQCFADVERGLLKEDRGGHDSNEWIRVGDQDFVIY